ncbi:MULTISPECIES: hypothetical protein [unclassified Pseudomonas]|uniref:hypothetical protein n=1 Tax=unclassified Pseudomonas TaxID=196821 RepID=UPI00244D58D5|nr:MULTISPECIES: hypothetical protein [unclassified Pseudomonas]MDH0300967.1 hypothetical protein [Pseudomonas sp. GD04091]MDH1983501.1 hypothetical protein [Pseudomonas sp. GD03689]
MKLPAPRLLIIGLLALATVGPASAAQMKTSSPASTPAPKVAAIDTPWPSLAGEQTGPLLAHDDRYRHDGRWHDRRDDWRREQWRREQWRREQHRRAMERQRYWERHHDRALHHRYDDDRRYYRR